MIIKIQNDNDNKGQRGHTYLQWLFAIMANLATLGYGIEAGWISPTTKILKSESSPTGSAMSDKTLAWIASSMSMAGVLGVIVFAYITDRFGRKAGIILLTIPQAISWIIKITYPTTVTFIAARISAGIASGGVFIVIPMYIKEISQDNIRGTLGTLLSVSQNIGVLTMYAMGGYLDYNVVLYCAVGIPIIAGVLMLLAPESPGFLVKQGQIEKAKETVAKLRGLKTDDERVKKEIEYMKETDEYYKSLPKLEYKDILKDKCWRKGLILIILTYVFHALNGAIVIVTYALSILESTGVKFNISPQLQTLSLPVIMIISALSLTVLVDRFGRKWLLASAFFLTSISMLILGVATYVQQMGIDVPNWLPALVMVAAAALYSGGVAPLPYIIVTEIFSFQVRAKMMGGVISMSWFLAFLNIFSYPYLASFGSYVPFFFYTVINLLGAVFVTLFLPETKGKSDEEVRQQLCGNRKH